MYNHLSNMLRLSANTFRPLTLLRSSLRKAPNFSSRPFSNGLVQCVRKEPSRLQISLPMRFRTIMTDRPMIQETNTFSWGKLAMAAAGVAGVVVVLDTAFNRETRDSLSPAERSLLNDSFKYTGGGLALTAVAARSLFQSGFAFRIMSANPWVFLGVSLVGSIGTMMGTLYTPTDKPVQKHLFWLAFNACQAATLSPLFFFSPAILSRAALYTCGVVGSISYVGATATNDKYLHLGGPLLAGVTVVALSSLAPMIIPMSIRSLMISESISLYGGLAVFGGFVLYDTQKILLHARMAEQGHMKADPVSESISLELDMINIFIRLVQILSNNRNKS